jgi:nicotinate-nucleotide adenylyltransferase
MRRSARIGILGGTFNPIHLGHLRSAEEIAEDLELERVLFIPSAEPPHKGRSNLAPAPHRMAMVRLAIARNPRFRASAVEIERGGRSYSVETLRQLRTRLGSEYELYFILGLDAFREIESWKEYAAIFALAHLVVISRPPAVLEAKRARVPVAVRSQFCYRPRRGWIHRSGHTVLFRSVTPLAISASDIRSRLLRRGSIRYLVPPPVERYIARHGLYQRGLAAVERA